MTYRKITVEGKDYLYVIGKTNMKIVDVGVFKNAEIADKFYFERKEAYGIVTPAVIHNVIDNFLHEIQVVDRYGNMYKIHDSIRDYFHECQYNWMNSPDHEAGILEEFKEELIKRRPL